MSSAPIALTVAIKCHHDWRVFSLLDSIDEQVDTLVLLAPDDVLGACVRARGARCVTVDTNDIGLRCNAALAGAENDRTLLLDSDCILEPGALRRIAEALDEHPVVRMRLEFQHGTRFTSRAIARWRTFENHAVPTLAYMPGLGLRRDELRRSLGTKSLFEEGIPAAIDAAFDDRLRAVGVAVLLVDDAVLVHDTITLRHFLRSGFRTGIGTARLVQRGLRPHHERLLWGFTRALRLLQLRTFVAWARAAGVDAALLGVAWTLSYRVGFLREMWRV